MSFWRRHDDADLEALVAGTVSPRRRQRISRHVRSCARCGPRYERLVAAHRALAGRPVDEPGPAELAALREANRAAVLRGAQAAVPERPRRWIFALAAAGAAAVLVVAIFPGPDEFRSRGGAGADGAVLRVFCVPVFGAPKGLPPEDPCPVGASLAFAAGAKPPLTQVLVSVAGGTEQYEGAVSGTEGHEAAVPFVTRLRQPGRVEIIATFFGEGGATVQRQFAVRVEPAP